MPKRKCGFMHGLQRKYPFISSIQRVANRKQSSGGREGRFSSTGKTERRELRVKWCERDRRESCCCHMSSCCWQGRVSRSRRNTIQTSSPAFLPPPVTQEKLERKKMLSPLFSSPIVSCSQTSRLVLVPVIFLILLLPSSRL